MASWNLMRILSTNEKTFSHNNRIQDLILIMTRGMPNNPTTEMDLTLWKIAKILRQDQLSLQVAQHHTPTQLSQRYQAGKLPSRFMNLIDGFLNQYGGRGFGEIDLGRTRWAEEPAHVFEMLKSFLLIDNEDQAPDVVFARGAKSAEEGIEELISILRECGIGWPKLHLVRFLAGRARQLMGLRESPKFFAVRMMWHIHRELLKSGDELVKVGALANKGDLFYLTFDEMKKFALREERNWHELIAARQEAYRHELRRRQIPRMLLSDGRAFYKGFGAAEDGENVITGSPVSPGEIEGNVRIVLNPTQANLKPGEIMICPGTDPSWTPLFLTAAGLVMETGGMMTHGAVVAREYGIPAIVGIDQATHRLKTGQRIRIDGSSGRIEILDET
jgi:pyruvate,water dikinase